MHKSQCTVMNISWLSVRAQTIMHARAPDYPLGVSQAKESAVRSHDRRHQYRHDIKGHDILISSLGYAYY